MEEENRAYFVYSPRTAEELLRPHDLNSETPYECILRCPTAADAELNGRGAA